nr:uncharacterized protein LOC104648455 isoform X1 [Solanum lycopersicum]
MLYRLFIGVKRLSAKKLVIQSYYKDIEEKSILKEVPLEGMNIEVILEEVFISSGGTIFLLRMLLVHRESTNAKCLYTLCVPSICMAASGFAKVFISSGGACTFLVVFPLCVVSYVL